MEEQALEGLLLLPASGRGLLHRSLGGLLFRRLVED